MAIGSLNLTPEDKLVEKLEASLKKKREVAAAPSPALPPQPIPKLNSQSTKRTKVRPYVRTNERTILRPDESTNNRTKGRKKIRHAFDIFEDQLIALKEAQLSRQKARRGRYNLGDLVQEALDLFLANERTNGQVNI